jgi:hypothetical protein
MKPSLRRLREKYDIKAKFEEASSDTKAKIEGIVSSYQSAKQFRKDREAKRWWDKNCKGKTTSETVEEIRRGVNTKEISLAQANNILRTMELAGYISMEESDWY